MLTELFDQDRRLRIEYKKLINSNYFNIELLEKIDNYFNDFIDYNNIPFNDIIKRYNNFLIRYSSDIENFLSSGKYPYLLDKNKSVQRIDYHISLILSTVLTIPRHRIINNLYNYCKNIKGNILIIGLGSGLELEILYSLSSYKRIDAYDISISNFVKDRFKNKSNIVESEFNGNDEFYDFIIAIELLEHLSNPYQFLSMCYQSLKKEGIILTTTATDIPQFDHLYNFDNENYFEKKIKNIGLSISYSEEIKHHQLKKNFHPKNTWYILNKL